MFAIPGELIAERFEVERHIGAGGMGVVYRAFDRKTDGMAAVKLVRAGDAVLAERFAREARALAELVHPSIVGYIAHGQTADGAFYLAMEWLDGEDLATRLQVARLSISETIALVKQAVSALAAAHARGIVHRDVKPSNLFLVDWQPERAKLLDFGVAQLADLTSLTGTGALIGTPQYMAPEQLDGREIDARTDVFALGAVMFHALTGAPPFPARSLPELVASLGSADAARRVRTLVPQVPVALDELVARMLAKDPAMRPRDAGAVAAALDGITPETAPSVAASAATVGAAAPPAPDPTVDDLMKQGRAEFVEGHWNEARAAYEAALALQDGPQLRSALGETLWWLGDAHGAIAQYERAFAMLRMSDAPPAMMGAAATALGIAMVHKKTFDNDAAANGWVARAARILGDAVGPLHGFYWLVQGFCTNDPTRAVKLHEQALAHGKATNNHRTEVIALAALGGSLVCAGEVERGLALIDESMAETFASGATANFETVVPVTCCMVIACDQIADSLRLLQWCRVADRFMVKYGSAFLFAECRAHYGSALLATGKWKDAEVELEAAKTATSQDTAFYTLAVTRLAELRVRQGRLDEAEHMLAGISDRPQTRGVAASLRHAAGEHALAGTLLRRFIDHSGSKILDVAAALDLLVDTSVAAGDHATATAAVTRLAELARIHRAPVVGAHAAFAAGRLATAKGDGERARESLERGHLFTGVNAPHEAARAKFALAKLLAASEAPVAVNEARLAKAAFDRLGANRDAVAAGELLRTLGASA